MKKAFTRIMLLAVLMASAAGAKAENVLYAVKSGTSITIKFGEAEAGACTFDETETWLGTPADITSATIDASCADYNGTSLRCLFAKCSNLSTIEGLENLNTSSVTDMQDMFKYCSSLTTLDLSSFDTRNVTNIRYMFYNCTSLSTLIVGGWNTAEVGNMQHIFYNCNTLTSLDLSGWNTAKVQNMSYMFGSCKNLVSIYVGDGWSLASLLYSENMFLWCYAIVGEDGTTFSAANYTYAHCGAGGYLSKIFRLYDDASNDDNLTAWNGKTLAAVKILGRTLKAGHWNTLYLPFALDADQIAESFPAGTKVKTFNSYSNDGSTLTIGFADAETMEAGYPYIVYIPEGEDIANPVFSNVTIKPEYNGIRKGDATFSGFYNPMDFGSSRYRLFLQNDMFYYPTADGANLNAFRGYFYITDATKPVPETASARIIIDWGDGETTGIASMQDGRSTMDHVWYDLSGRKLAGQPSEKGIYIYNDKKVAVQ